METLVSSFVLVLGNLKNHPASQISANRNPNTPNLVHRNRSKILITNRKFQARVRATGDFSAAVDTAQVELSWQIVVGTIAGVTPFVVAGIEFGKRIVAQRRCEVCGGSGLVQREKYYFRCPGCDENRAVF
ncbi:uncharacterized protein LOC122070426 isoform X2 [Macadamia integrifolia]|uniref:uncharacterized protein LOC122070426 isoform X2 n=1 Tax=Macadamia integrifolia TaxID=60698 RepID=UPI001C4F3811|nr:uncharacterized protein LOC122070426 isoform X2 [Macadamia integrifolia]